MSKLVHFGAGNIGRAFIGRIFGLQGWDVVFVDIDRDIITRINQQNGYRIVIKEYGKADKELMIPHIRAVDSRAEKQVIQEIITADLISTSVGSKILPVIAPLIAEGIQARSEHTDAPINIILAENLHDGRMVFEHMLLPYFPATFPFREQIGIIETSIGKMVPLMKKEENAQDPTLIYSEAFNTLILGKKWFLGPIPQVDDLLFVDRIDAYVDRKLFIHNLGHAVTAYLSYAFDPSLQYIWQGLSEPVIMSQVRATMRQSADAVQAAYPEVFTIQELGDHIDDLIQRFQNRALGDTIFRVGKDLPRKLSRNDRIVGAMLLAEKQHLPYDLIARAYIKAGTFYSQAPEKTMFPEDIAFHRNYHGDIMRILDEVSRLDESDPADASIIHTIERVMTS